MNFDNYEGTAIDVEMFNPVEGNIETTPIDSTETGVTETADPTNEGIVTETQVEEPKADTGEIEIPGIGKVSTDEVKEWKQGYLRQSDYTRKTQELAHRREQLQNAEQLLNYLNANPHLIEAMKNAEGGNVPYINNMSPESQMIRQLAYNQKAMEVDMKVSQLKAKYGDIDEVALFNKAAELKTDDLEFVYQGLKAAENNSSVDVEEIKRLAVEQAKAELKNELEANRSAVNTTVNTKQPQQIEQQTVLTPDQKRVAAAMGMSEAEYAQWM